MTQEKPRMEIKWFIYFTLIFLALLLLINAFMWTIGIMHLAKKHNHELVIIFSVLEVVSVGAIVWCSLILSLHRKKNYTKGSVIALFITAFFGIVFLQLLIWGIHYINYKIFQDNQKLEIEENTATK